MGCAPWWDHQQLGNPAGLLSTAPGRRRGVSKPLERSLQGAAVSGLSPGEVEAAIDNFCTPMYLDQLSLFIRSLRLSGDMAEFMAGLPHPAYLFLYLSHTENIVS